MNALAKGNSCATGAVLATFKWVGFIANPPAQSRNSIAEYLALEWKTSGQLVVTVIASTRRDGWGECASA
jgi:hypothetical protein